MNAFKAYDIRAREPGELNPAVAWAYLVTENEFTFIPVGQEHCLENPGRISLELIEVQTGSYLGEDDVVRIEDPHGRP